MRWHIADDPYFNPTEMAPPPVFFAQNAFLNGAKKRLTPDVWHGERLMMLSHKAHIALDISDETTFQNTLGDFAEDANILLNFSSSDLAPQIVRRSTEGSLMNFPELAAEALKDFSSECDLNNVPWFAIGGTFLGAAREENFLVHDLDIDVGVFANQVDSQDLIRIFESAQTFTISKLDLKSEIYMDTKGDHYLAKQPACLKVIHDTGINIDIFIHYHLQKKIIHGSGSLIWENADFELKPYPLGSQTVLGPKNADKYLIEHYGNWRVEQTDYSCVTDTNNIAYVRNLGTIAFHIRRFVLAKTVDKNSALTILRSMEIQGIVQKSNEKIILNKEWFLKTKDA